MELFERINISKKYKAIDQMLVFGLFFFAPTQLARHFWPEWTYIFGIRSDFLALTISVMDILICTYLVIHRRRLLHILLSIPVFVRIFLVVGGLIHLLFSQQSFHSAYVLIHGGGYLLALYIVTQSFSTYSKTIRVAFTFGAIVQFVLVGLQIVSQSSVQGVWYWLGERAFTLSLPDVAKVYVQGREYLRPYGTFSHPNSLAGFYVFVFFFFQTVFRKSDRIVWDLLVLVLAPLMVVATLSKTAVMVFACVYVWQMIARKRMKSSRLLLTMQVVGIALLVVSMFGFAGDPESLTKRIDMARNAFLLVVAYPLTGVGIGNYLIAQSSTIRNSLFTSYYQPVHNVLLLILAEVGMVGVISGYVAIRLRIPTIMQRVQTYKYLVAVVALTGMMDHYWLTLPQNQFLLLFLVALLLQPIPFKRKG